MEKLADKTTTLNLYWKYLINLRAGYDGSIHFDRVFVLWKNPDANADVTQKYLVMTYPA